MVTILMGIARRSATEMAVTNRRVGIKTGLASRKTIEMLLNKVESIEVSETASGRTLGYGSIVVIGTGGTPEPFHKVAHRWNFAARYSNRSRSCTENAQHDAADTRRWNMIHSTTSTSPGVGRGSEMGRDGGPKGSSLRTGELVKEPEDSPERSP